MATQMYNQGLHGSHGYNGGMDDDVTVVKKEKGEEEVVDFHEIDGYDAGPISEEDAWTVIAAHFQERGLVGQQLDSFDYFLTSTMQVRQAKHLFTEIFIPSQLQTYS